MMLTVFAASFHLTLKQKALHYHTNTSLLTTFANSATPPCDSKQMHGASCRPAVIALGILGLTEMAAADVNRNRLAAVRRKIGLF
jgi:hypothetical protein